MKKPGKPLREKQFISTVGGLMCCTPPEFEQAAYKGLKSNCGRPTKHEGGVKKHAPSHPASQPTNVGDPNKRK